MNFHLLVVTELLFQVYSDLEVAFIISEEEAIFKALSKTVEVLQGITAPISQYYYGCLFHELLSFQLADRHPRAEVSVIALFLRIFIVKCILNIILVKAFSLLEMDSSIFDTNGFLYFERIMFACNKFNKQSRKPAVK